MLRLLLWIQLCFENNTAALSVALGFSGRFGPFWVWFGLFQILLTFCRPSRFAFSMFLTIRLGCIISSFALQTRDQLRFVYSIDWSPGSVEKFEKFLVLRFWRHISRSHFGVEVADAVQQPERSKPKRLKTLTLKEA